MMNVDSIETQSSTEEKMLRETILKEWDVGEKIKNYDIVKIQDGVFGIYYKGKELTGYVNEKAKILIALKKIRGLPTFKTALEIAGLSEENIEGENTLFEIKDGEKRKIDKFSKEYFEKWQNIMFFTDKQILSADLYKGIDNDFLDIVVSSEAITIFDLATFLNEKKITQEQFDKYLPKVKSLLSRQLFDKRFSKFNKWIISEAKKTGKGEIHISSFEEELEIIYTDMIKQGNKPLINKELYEEIRMEIQKAKEEKEKQDKQAIQGFQSELGELNKSIII